VHEHILTAILLDEAIALLVAEPLHSAFCQRAILSLKHPGMRRIWQP
jgi:hypothetical protein